MGILLFYSWLSRAAPGAFRAVVQDKTFDVVAMDLNGVLHQTLETGLVAEHELQQRCFGLLDDVLSLVGRGAQLVAVCLDGVPPRAKMNQQLSRRHISAAPGQGGLDSNMLSPGTVAMARAAGFVRLFFQQRSSQFPRVIVSDSGERGEGEHKIASLLRRLPRDTNVCVYGADSDLVFLAGLAHLERITIVREWRKPCGKCRGMHRSELCSPAARNCFPFELFDVQLFSAKIAGQFGRNYGPQVWRDLTLVTCFVGNDFVPRHPLLNARADLSTLWSCYWALQQDGECVLVDERGCIRAVNLARLLRALVPLETCKIGNFAKGGSKRDECSDATESVATLEEALRGVSLEVAGERQAEAFRASYARDHPSNCGDYVRTLQWIMGYYMFDTADCTGATNTISRRCFRSCCPG